MVLSMSAISNALAAPLGRRRDGIDRAPSSVGANLVEVRGGPAHAMSTASPGERIVTAPPSSDIAHPADHCRRQRRGVARGDEGQNLGHRTSTMAVSA